MSQAEGGSKASDDELPQSKLFEYIETAVAITLRLVPAVIRIALHYTFRPRRFQELSTGIGKEGYRVPPYIFLTTVAVGIVTIVGLAVTVVQIRIDDFANSWKFAEPSSHHAGRLRLASQLQMIEDRSLTAVFFTTAAMVIVLAAMARGLAKALGGTPAFTPRVERLLCYIIGAQQIQIVLLFPAAIFLFAMTIEATPALPIGMLLLYLGYCLVLPVVIVARTLRRVAPARGRFSRIAAGVVVALLTPAIVGFVSYASEAGPKAAHRWRDELLSEHAPLRYQLGHAQGAVTDGKVVLTLAIYIADDRPLVIDVPRARLAALREPENGFAYGMDQYITLLDSSAGPVSIVPIGPGETKWIRISAPLSEQMRQDAISTRKWSGTLHCGGGDQLALSNIPLAVEP